jgi:allantoicase
MTTPIANENAALDLPNLASEQLGAKIVFATDEWFSQAPNMLQDSTAKFDENTFSEYGKEMDGWECRRRRTEGNDWAIVKLGVPGVIDTIEVDTLWFTGNFSPQCSIYATYYDSNSEPAEVQQSIDERAVTVAARGEKGLLDGRTGLCATEREWELVRRLDSDRWNALDAARRRLRGDVEDVL